MTERRWPRWLLIAAVWALPAFYFAIQVYLQRAFENRSITVTQALLRGIIFWVLWALLSPLILKLAKAFPFKREHWSDALLLHLPAGTIFSLAHLLLYVILTSWLGGNPLRTFDELLAEFQPAFLSSFAWWSLVYWTILLASYALEFYERYQTGLLRASQLEAQVAQAELQALKMQLHPHFLFNTLNSISALMHVDIETADKMVARLGDFLRMTLNNTASFEITVAEEMRFLECYLAIERLRFQDRLSIAFEIDDETLMARLPNLILQPIVENAIRHGIAPRTGQGQLSIRARRVNDHLRIEVEDNGPGPHPSGTSPNGLGLANTRARLERSYGSSHLLQLARVDHGGFIVSLEVPWKLEGTEKNNA